MKKLLFVFFICAAQLIQAQEVELGVKGGVALYSGDLSAKEFGVYFETLGPSFGGFARVNFNRALALRFDLTYGKIIGSDEFGAAPERGLEIQTDVFEAALIGELSLFTVGGRTTWSPYIFGGVGIFRYNPEGLFDGDYIELQPLGTEGQGIQGYEEPYNLTETAIPMGVGMKFVFNQTWALGFEFGGRKLFTDYLDDISGNEVNFLDVLTNNGTIAATMSAPQLIDRENLDINYTRGGEFDDWYYFGQVTVSFFLGKGGGGGGATGMPCYQF
ncbi:MAG: DUF6089 family protein [Saprospiraceae bacterium]|nr:DUF6089 family protein [Saprospiraceae bacterium]